MSEKKIPIHEKKFSIAWGDMDALGHVNNTRYFDYFQEARIEWLQTLNLNLRQIQGPVVIQVACTFLNAVIYPAELTIKSSIENIGNSSMVINHDLYQNETLMAQGMSKIVWVDYQLNKSIPLPAIIRTLAHV